MSMQPSRVPAPPLRKASRWGVTSSAVCSRIGVEKSMKTGTVGAGLTAWLGALLSSLCCLLPLAVILLGLGSGAFMAGTMQYPWLLIPPGVVGVMTGFGLFLPRRRRFAARACPIAGGRINR